MQIDGTSSVRLVYRDVEPLGGANINCRMGSTRFWFKPNWNTGNGPGATGYFLTLGNTTTNADGWWALSVNSTGDHLSCQLHELEAFNCLLSASEISANYNQLTATAPIAIDLPGAINTNFITATLSGADDGGGCARVAGLGDVAAFACTITATLGNTNGDYTVYFGSRTILGTVLWIINFFTLDTVAPMITLENPPSSLVTNLLLHVRARCRRGSAVINLS